MEKQQTLKMKVEEAKELPLVAEGDYTAKVSKVEPDQTGAFGTMVRISFDIEGTDVQALCSQKLNSNTKMYAWAGILLGRKLDVGETLDFSQLVGKSALVTVRNRAVKDETGAAQVRNGKTVLTSNIIELRPPKIK